MDYNSAIKDKGTLTFPAKWMELENICTVKSLSAIKNNEIMIFTGKWIEFNSNILSKVTQI